MRKVLNKDLKLINKMNRANNEELQNHEKGDQEKETSGKKDDLAGLKIDENEFEESDGDSLSGSKSPEYQYD